MMRQEINLFQKTAAQKRSTALLTWHRLLIATAGLIGIFILLYCISIIQVHYLKSKRDKLITQVAQLEHKFTTIRATFPASFFSQDVSQSISQLAKELQTQEKLLVSIKNKLSFSQILLSLTRVIETNVWLNNINIMKGGDEITLKGQSIGMEPLQRFIASLLHEKNYLDYALQVKNIENENKKNATNNLTFEITIAKRQV